MSRPPKRSRAPSAKNQRRSGSTKGVAGLLGVKVRRPAKKRASRSKKAVAPVDPAERKVRNWIISLAVFAAVINGYMFLGRDDWGRLGVRSAVMRDEVRRGYGIAPLDACSGQSRQIFAGLTNLLHLRTRLSAGRSLRLSLLELGVAATDIDALEVSLRETIDPAVIEGSGAPLRAAVDADFRLIALEIEPSDGHVVQACRDRNGYEVRNLQHPLQTQLSPIRLTIGADASLSSALALAGEQEELSVQLAEVSGTQVDFARELRPGDVLEVLVEKRFLGSEFHRYGDVIALRFRGFAGRFERYYFAQSGAPARFVDADGKYEDAQLLRSPFAYLDPSYLGASASGPQSEFVRGQVGAVFVWPTGAPVVALAAGRVAEVGEDELRGKWLDLAFESGWHATYWHLDRTMHGIVKDKAVARGDMVGLVGRSGKASGPRLRLELRDPEGKAIYPEMAQATAKLREQTGGQLSESDLEAFKRDVATWRKLLKNAGRSGS